MKVRFRLTLLVTTLLWAAMPLCSEEIVMQNASTTAMASAPSWMKSATAKLQRDLTEKYGDQQRTRIERGLRQAAEFWRAEDGDAAAFEEFVHINFAGDQTALDTMFNRWQAAEQPRFWVAQRFQRCGNRPRVNRGF